MRFAELTSLPMFVITEEQLTEIPSTFDADIPVRGEELGGDVTNETTWIIDPIDGTGHFTRGMPWATTMVALIHEGVVATAVINNFATGELYTAARGCGATKNGQAIHVIDRPFPNVCVFYDFDLRETGHPELLRTLDSRFPTMCICGICASGQTYVSIAQGSCVKGH